MFPKYNLIACLLVLTAATAALAEQRDAFVPTELWPDNNGVPINAHAGGVIHHDGTYYWFGQHMIGGKKGNKAQVGVSAYSSTDLYNWKDEGIVLPVSEEPGHPIEKGCVLERPKVIYNAQTGKFVMWFHLELKGQRYRAALSGVAVADKILGPYTFVDSFRPNAGHWPINVTEDQKDPESIAKAAAVDGKLSGGESEETKALNVLGAHHVGGQMARDMNLFVDDDGQAYHIYSSEHNSTLHISLLTDDYLKPSGKYVRVFPKRWMEAPAMFKHDGKYYLLMSGCSGWRPNAARSAVADNIFGPWKELDNPCVGENPIKQLGPDKTFGGQSTCVFPVQGKPGAFIAMFDIWNPKNAIDGRYMFLPVIFKDQGFEIPYKERWDLSVFK